MSRIKEQFHEEINQDNDFDLISNQEWEEYDQKRLKELQDKFGNVTGSLMHVEFLRDNS